MSGIVACWCLLSLVTAQVGQTPATRSPAVGDLLAAEWDVRNATASRLSETAAIDVEARIEALVEVLRHEWRGVLPDTRGWGAMAAALPETSPRLKVMYEAREQSIAFPPSPIAGHQELRTAADLVGPLHPHELVVFVLRHMAPTPRELEMPLDSMARARAWLLLARPTDEQLVAACAKQPAADLVAGALWLDGEPGRTRLMQLLGGDHLPLRRAIVKLREPSLHERPEGLATVVEQFLTDPQRDSRRFAGALLRDLGARSAAPLAARCGDDRTQRQRALALLCLLGNGAAAAADVLLRHVDSDAVSRRRALVALASFELPEPLRATAAAQFLAVVDTADATTAMLAIDALGHCGEGVDAAMRERLRALLVDDQRPGLAARALGCLHRLGALDPTGSGAGAELTQWFELAAHAHATTYTWLALVAHGDAAADRLRVLLQSPPAEVLLDRVLAEFARRAERSVSKWLDDRDPAVCLLALRALQVREPGSGIDPGRATALLQREPEIASATIGWLTERDDVAHLAPAVFARSTELMSGPDWPWRSLEFARRVKLPLALKVDMLAEVLKTGRGWEVVRGGDTALLRGECRRWISMATDDAVRHRLLGELCRLGLETEAEFEMVREALGTRDLDAVLEGLAAGPEVPAALRPALQELLLQAQDRFSSVHLLAIKALRPRSE